MEYKKYNFGFTDNTYKTPATLYNMALEHYGLSEFDLDVCCTDTNIPAKNHYRQPYQDGLLNEWLEYNWCNPPFNESKKWVAKASKECEKGRKTAMLIPVRTETAYWHDYILFNPKVHIQWLRKGYRFLNANNEEMGVFKNALAIVYFG